MKQESKRRIIVKILRCSFCGGSIEILPGMTNAVCINCGSVFPIPVNLDKRDNLINHAIFLRQNFEFDRAISAYEELIQENDKDANAHWGLLLCKYGIEYIPDFRGNYIPTFHHINTSAFSSDPEYKLAIELSDANTKKIFEVEAGRIQDAQKKTLDFINERLPYDVFICYDNKKLNNPTPSNKLANEIYDRLTQKGYRVFLVDKELEGKSETDYEPIICAALVSSTLMIVVGTTEADFSTVRVKNRWFRFINMNHELHREIILAYSGISSNQLPAELAHFDSQDMTKVGALHDLSDGVERYIPQSINNKINHTKQEIDAQITRLLHNGEIYLNIKNYSSAEQVYQKITILSPQDYRGWWELIQAQTQNFEYVIMNNEDLNSYFEHIKNNAPVDLILDYEKEYLKYIHLIAQTIANNDIKEVNSMKLKYKQEIMDNQKKIDGIQRLIDSENKRFHQQTDEYNKEIQRLKEEITELEKKIHFHWSQLLFWIMLCIGVYLFLTTEVNDEPRKGLLGLLMTVLSGNRIWHFWGNNKNDEYRGAISGHNSGIKVNTDIYNRNKQEHEQRIHDYNTRIVPFTQLISTLKLKTDMCQKYIDFGVERISDYIYAIKCADLGKQIAIEQDIADCRDKILMENCEK